MPEMTSHAPGTFCWVELGTTDASGTKAFYSQLFGWTTTDTPAGPGMTYTMLRVDGKDVGALYELQQEHRDQGVPPHWMSYVAVASADEAARRAGQAGGKVVMEPFDVMEVGRMAILQDPGGSTLAVWEARKHIGARLVGDPGSMCWHELATRDTAAAAKFYAAVFGWQPREQDMGPMKYTLFMNRNQQTAGMYAMSAEMAGIPPHWMPYFAVEDCDNTAEQAQRLRGVVLVPPSDIPGVGRFATLRDPHGAAFSIIRLMPRAA